VRVQDVDTPHMKMRIISLLFLLMLIGAFNAHAQHDEPAFIVVNNAFVARDKAVLHMLQYQGVHILNKKMLYINDSIRDLGALIRSSMTNS